LSEHQDAIRQELKKTKPPALPESVKRRLIALLELSNGASLNNAAKKATLSRTGTLAIKNRILKEGLNAILTVKKPQTSFRKPILSEAEEIRFINKYLRRKKKGGKTFSIRNVRAIEGSTDLHWKTKTRLLKKHGYIVLNSGVVQKR